MAKKRESKNYTWNRISHITDCYSESLFSIVLAYQSLNSCFENMSWSMENLALSDRDGSGSLLERVKKAERKLNAEIKKWEDDPLFQAELKARLEVLHILKKQIQEKMEQIRERIPELQRVVDDIEHGDIEPYKNW